MRTAVIGSGALHLAFVVFLFAVRTSAPMVVPGPDVVQVALLDASAALTPPRVVPPTPEKPAIREPQVKPTDETGIRLEKPKPAPRKPAPETEEAPPLPMPALPYAAVGPAGLRGAVAVDIKDFEFTYYLVLVRNKIASNWTPPGGLAGGSGARAVVYFRIGRNGDVRGTSLESGSRFEFFDRSALRAVMLSDPLPPLPLGFSGSDLGVHFGFEYGGP